MPPRNSSSLVGKVADLALAALVVLAPLAAGSWKLKVLPLLMAIAILGWAAIAASATRSNRRLHSSALSAALLALAGYTALQAVPLPAGLLSSVSPHASSLRAFIAGGLTSGPLSYEPGATWREAAKLVLYALVVQTARERARAHGLRDRVAKPLVAAGLIATGVAVLHRVLGIDRLFGFIDTLTSPRHMLATFANPNHTAGFMVLVTLTAVGLAADTRDTPRRLAFIATAMVAASVTLLSLSKGGIGALVLGLGLYGGLTLWRRRRPAPGEPGPRPLILAALTLAVIGVLTWRSSDLVSAYLRGPHYDALGLVEKAAALQDALPMIRDHLLVGVGRGSYVSVYTAYKTSPLQLTFAFPENILAQLTSEWGVVVGCLALYGLTAAVLNRLWRARRPLAVAMMCGVTAVLVQNLVDFSWELPGMAIPLAAILGATSADWTGTPRLSSTRPVFWIVVLVPPLLGVTTLILAFVAGDLSEDISSVQARIQAAQAKDPIAIEPALPIIVARHPASAMMAAQAAYLLEIREPPDLPGAIALANRTLYLAPTYAGGHLVAGRLLIKAGRRAQGFEELRQAWALSGSDTLARYIDHVLELARSPEEVAHAIPRRDPALDIVSERELARAVHRLATTGRTAWARTLLTELVDVAEVPQDDLRAVTVAADAAGDPELALAAAERLLALDPEDQATRLLAAQISFRHGRKEDARRLLDSLEGGGPAEEAMLELRLRVELEDRDTTAAQATLKALRARAAPSAAREAELSMLEAELYRRGNDLGRSLEVLDAALARQPGSVELRHARASLLLDLRRPEAARQDLLHIQKRRPQDARVRRLLERLDAETR